MSHVTHDEVCGPCTEDRHADPVREHYLASGPRCTCSCSCPAPRLVHAPWSDEQVAALDRWQRSECVHPFTCGDRDGHPWNEDYFDYGPLIPTNAGWVCEHCDYTQDWAHAMMFYPVPATIREMLRGDA